MFFNKLTRIISNFPVLSDLMNYLSLSIIKALIIITANYF